MSMWMFRLAKRTRWKPEATLDDAALDFTPRMSGGEVERISLFKINSPEEGTSVATYYGVTLRHGPDHLDFVVFDDEHLQPLQTAHVPGDLHPFLDERHHEVPGFEDEAVRKTIVGRIKGSPTTKPYRLDEKILIESAKELVKDEEVRRRLKGKWISLLGPALLGPAPLGPAPPGPAPPARTDKASG